MLRSRNLKLPVLWLESTCHNCHPTYIRTQRTRIVTQPTYTLSALELPPNLHTHSAHSNCHPTYLRSQHTRIAIQYFLKLKYKWNWSLCCSLPMIYFPKRTTWVRYRNAVPGFQTRFDEENRDRGCVHFRKTVFQQFCTDQCRWIRVIMSNQMHRTSV